MASMVIGLPMALTIAMIHGRDWIRTFCIGAIFPVGSVYINPFTWAICFSDSFDPGIELDNRTETLFFIFGLLMACLVSGLAAIGTRRLVEGANSPDESCESINSLPGSEVADGESTQIAHSTKSE